MELTTQGRKRSATATSLAKERVPVNKRLLAVGGGECLFPALQAAFNLLMLLSAELRSRFV